MNNAAALRDLRVLAAFLGHLNYSDLDTAVWLGADEAR